MRTALRVNERGVADSIGSLDVNVGFDDVKSCGRGRSRGDGNSGRHAESDEVAPVLEISGIVCHVRSPGYFTLLIHFRIGAVTLVSAVSGDSTSEMWL